jgi:uncharacterized membrane protein
MKSRLIKIIRVIAILVALYFFGYTSLLGGPFWLAKFFFVITAIGAIIFSIFSIFLWRIKIFSKKISMKSNEQETIKVDVEVIE